MYIKYFIKKDLYKNNCIEFYPKRKTQKNKFCILILGSSSIVPS